MARVAKQRRSSTSVGQGRDDESMVASDTDDLEWISAQVHANETGTAWILLADSKAPKPYYFLKGNRYTMAVRRLMDTDTDPAMKNPDALISLF